MRERRGEDRTKAGLTGEEEMTGAKTVSRNNRLRTVRDGLVYVAYIDHVLYNRASALAMKPQIRETVGWLIYESDEYVTLVWDRDAEPPTIRDGDPKASGLVLLRSDILELKRLGQLIPS